MGLFGGSKNLLGLDVGASAIKIIRGTKNGNTFSVDKLSIVPLPTRSFDEQGNPGDAIVGHLASGLEQANERAPEVATAVRGPGVLTKRINISHFPKKEIPDQVRWEAEQVFPMDISTIFIDHILLGEVKSIPGAPPGTPGWDILLIGVRQDTVVRLNGLLEAASVTLKVMDVDAFVVGDFLEGILGLPKNEAIAFVDIGASGTRIGVRYRGNVIFIREFAIGGNAFTQAIAQALGLSFDDAESIKIQDGSGVPQEAQEALQSILQSWKNEIQQSEDVFVTQDPSALITKWILFGGGSLTPGLIDFLRDEHFGDKIVPLASAGVLTARGRNVDANLLQLWAPRLITAAGLASRKA